MLTVHSRIYPTNLIQTIASDHLRVTEADGPLYTHALMSIKNALRAAEDYTNRIIVLSRCSYETTVVHGEYTDIPLYHNVYGDVSVVYNGSEVTEGVRVQRRRDGIRVHHPTLAVGAPLTINMVLGYDDISIPVAADDVEDANVMPGTVIQAVQLMAGTFFEFDADNVGGSVTELPTSAKSLLNPYRIYPYGEL